MQICQMEALNAIVWSNGPKKGGESIDNAESMRRMCALNTKFCQMEEIE